MKFSYFIISSFLLLTLNVKGQSTYLDDVAEKSCSCISEIPDSSEGSGLAEKLGLCMVNACVPYQKQFKKDYKLDVEDYTNIEVMRKLGGIIGVKCATKCPDLLASMRDKMKAANEIEPNKETTTQALSFEGIVISVNDNPFVYFTLKNEEGKTYNFYWLSFFASNINLSADYNKILFKKVKISYEEKEFYDPRIKEYKKFNVITELSTL